MDGGAATGTPDLFGSLDTQLGGVNIYDSSADLFCPIFYTAGSKPRRCWAGRSGWPSRGRQGEIQVIAYQNRLTPYRELVGLCCSSDRLLCNAK
jgi:hypothetical protein